MENNNISNKSAKTKQSKNNDTRTRSVYEVFLLMCKYASHRNLITSISIWGRE